MTCFLGAQRAVTTMPAYERSLEGSLTTAFNVPKFGRDRAPSPVRTRALQAGRRLLGDSPLSWEAPPLRDAFAHAYVRSLCEVEQSAPLPYGYIPPISKSRRFDDLLHRPDREHPLESTSRNGPDSHHAIHTNQFLWHTH